MTQTPTLPARETAQPVATPALPTLRLGGLSPLFPPACVADAGTLRMGGLSPVFARG
ncbi:hypothetical protein [Roseomonas sp. CECT 9278]|uniref:hypothetical protein n=1 Tax=Roseomonas sp. CECT 9278 TaxID=2845823 RepID=UPI001E5F4EC8|nr:hypothetical protein [Roseomonas sp. CECT 9278]CAH0313916.1 hypothetical protein ROS9278_05054 [Roseomonas sp. CECT 9278]